MKPKDADVMAYLITYIFPFIGVTQDNLIGFIVFFVILGIIYINSNMLYVNPILSLLQYHAYEIETDDGKTHIIIIHEKRVKTPTALNVVLIDDYFSMGKLV